jgi:hypothetical protein
VQLGSPSRFCIRIPRMSTKSLAFQAWHDTSLDHAVMSPDETRRPNIAEEI